MKGMLELKNVLHIEGIKANLLSISHLCDEDLMVYFDKRRCYVVKKDEEYIIMGTKIADNCYAVVDSVSITAKIDDVEL